MMYFFGISCDRQVLHKGRISWKIHPSNSLVWDTRRWVDLRWLVSYHYTFQFWTGEITLELTFQVSTNSKNVTKRKRNNLIEILLSLFEVCFSWLYFKVLLVLRGDFLFYYINQANYTNCTNFFRRDGKVLYSTEPAAVGNFLISHFWFLIPYCTN